MFVGLGIEGREGTNTVGGLGRHRTSFDPGTQTGGHRGSWEPTVQTIGFGGIWGPVGTATIGGEGPAGHLGSVEPGTQLGGHLGSTEPGMQVNVGLRGL